MADELTVLEECQRAIGYRFARPQLLRAALTHTSGADTRLGSNERLELLGDAVLGLVICDYLMVRFPRFQEGDLTRIKSVVVSRAVCAEMSLELGLGKFVFLGRGMQQHTQVASNLLANVFESVVGAIYQDGGLEPARHFLLPVLKPQVEMAAEDLAAGNAKTVLQQIGQRNFGGVPRYLVLAEIGPQHRKSFKVAAEIRNHCFPPAWGSNKKQAEVRAARNALADIQGIALPYPCEEVG